MTHKFYVALWDFGEWDEITNTRRSTRQLAEQLMAKLQPSYPPVDFGGRTLKVMVGDGC